VGEAAGVLAVLLGTWIATTGGRPATPAAT
jgi:hypothetical protein